MPRRKDEGDEGDDEPPTTIMPGLLDPCAPPLAAVLCAEAAVEVTRLPLGEEVGVPLLQRFLLAPMPPRWYSPADDDDGDAVPP